MNWSTWPGAEQFYGTKRFSIQTKEYTRALGKFGADLETILTKGAKQGYTLQQLTLQQDATWICSFLYRVHHGSKAIGDSAFDAALGGLIWAHDFHEWYEANKTPEAARYYEIRPEFLVSAQTRPKPKLVPKAGLSLADLFPGGI